MAMLYAHSGFATQNFVLYGLVIVSAMLALSSSRPLQATKCFPFIAVFFLYGTISIAWSDSPKQTTGALAVAFAELVIGLWLGRLGGDRSSSRTVQLAFVSIAVACLISGILVPELGNNASDDGWHGLMSSKNELGIFAAFALLHVVTYGRRKGRIVRIVLLGLVLLLSRSQGALVAALAALAIQLMASRIYFPKLRTHRLKHGRPLAFIAGVLVLVGTVWLVGGQLLALLGKDATLTRRTDIWQVLLTWGELEPWFGGGFAAQLYSGSAMQSAIQMVAGPTVHTAHNGYIPVYLGLGWLGVTLFTVALWSVPLIIHRIRRLNVHATRTDVLYAIGTLVVYLVIAISEDTTFKRGALLCLMIAVGRLSRHVELHGGGHGDPSLMVASKLTSHLPQAVVIQSKGRRDIS